MDTFLSVVVSNFRTTNHTYSWSCLPLNSSMNPNLLHRDSTSHFGVVGLAFLLSVCYVTFFVRYFPLERRTHCANEASSNAQAFKVYTTSSSQPNQKCARTSPGSPLTMAHSNSGLEGPSDIRQSFALPSSCSQT
jgi:hypothetical protein